MPASIHIHGQSTLPDGRVLVSGGNGDSGAVNTVYIYEPRNNIWSTVASLPVSIWCHGQSVLLDGKVLVSGGWTGSGAFVNTAYVYDVDNNGWSEVANIPVATAFRMHGQSTLNDGKVIITGGTTGGGSSVALSSVFIYNPNTDTWDANVEPLATGVSHHRQITLNDGKVFIGGGWANNGEIITTTYIYTYGTTNTWSNVEPLDYGNRNFGLSTLADGKVLVSGGYPARNAAYIYTPSSNTWASASSMPSSFGHQGQSTLADGRVLVSGGNGDTAYIYTPAGWGHIRVFFAARYQLDYNKQQ